MSLQEESPSAGSADGIAKWSPSSRASATRRCSRASSAPTCGAPRAPTPRRPRRTPRRCWPRPAARSRWPTARGGAIAGVRAFTPRRAEHGYEPAGSVLETNTDDLPFLVDSVGAELAARGLRIAPRHPPDRRRATATGRRRTGSSRSSTRATAPRESVMHFELDRRLEPEELADLEDAARHVLATVRARRRRLRRRCGRPRAPGRDRRGRRRAAGRRRAGSRRGDGVPALGAATSTSSSSASARTTDVDGAGAVVDGSGLGPARATRARPASCASPRPRSAGRRAGTRATPRSWRSPRPTRCRPCTGASR